MHSKKVKKRGYRAEEIKDFLWWLPIFLSQGRGLVFDPQGGVHPPPAHVWLWNWSLMFIIFKYSTSLLLEKYGAINNVLQVSTLKREKSNDE